MGSNSNKVLSNQRGWDSQTETANVYVTRPITIKTNTKSNNNQVQNKQTKHKTQTQM